jgi:hypothetical protein
MEKQDKMIQAEINKHVDKITFTVTKDTIQVLLHAMALALNNEFDFGSTRIQRVIDRTKLQFECIHAGTITADDLMAFCKEKGIKIEF